MMVRCRSWRCARRRCAGVSAWSSSAGASAPGSASPAVFFGAPFGAQTRPEYHCEFGPTAFEFECDLCVARPRVGDSQRVKGRGVRSWLGCRAMRSRFSRGDGCGQQAFAQRVHIGTVATERFSGGVDGAHTGDGLQQGADDQLGALAAIQAIDQGRARDRTSDHQESLSRDGCTGALPQNPRIFRTGPIRQWTRKTPTRPRLSVIARGPAVSAAADARVVSLRSPIPRLLRIWNTHRRHGWRCCVLLHPLRQAQRPHRRHALLARFGDDRRRRGRRRRTRCRARGT